MTHRQSALHLSFPDQFQLCLTLISMRFTMPLVRCLIVAEKQDAIFGIYVTLVEGWGPPLLGLWTRRHRYEGPATHKVLFLNRKSRDTQLVHCLKGGIKRNCISQLVYYIQILRVDFKMHHDLYNLLIAISCDLCITSMISNRDWKSNEHREGTFL